MAFCEGDDWWHRRDKLKIQIPFFRADSSLVSVAGEVRHISAQSQLIEPQKQNHCTEVPIRVEYQDIIFHKVPHYTCTVLARTDAVRRALLGDLCSDHSQLLGDLPLWVELSQLGTMAYLPETLASYRHSPNSATRQTDPLRIRRFETSFIDIRYRALQRYPLPGDPSRTSSAKANFARKIILKAAWNGDAVVARKQLGQLRGLGAKVGWKEIACLVLAFLPLPRRSLTLAYRKITPRLDRKGLKLGNYLGSEAVFPRPSDKE